ncbi:ATP-binding protein [Streptomyces sp. NPDC059582]|uniref:ATP-binding protein n=1 Tax=Streptomyces sp. NPDC059582 TaxID=3346875 RepID=UPI00368BF99D
MTAPAAHGDRPTLRSLLPVFLATAAASALVVAWAVAAAPSSVRGPLGWCAGISALLLCASVTVAAYGLRAARADRAAHRITAAEAQRAVEEGVRSAERWRQEKQDLGDAAAAERDRLVQAGEAERARLADEVRRLSAQLEQAAGERAAALSATANAAARMQALATGTLADLRAMEERHSDEEVLADLLHLDHRTAQAGRLADSVAVLTGARSGRRWARPIRMESILRGAMGRIGGYQRIRLHSVSDSAVAGHAAEGVMHALAELLDNAANFSPPNAEVHVYVEEVPAGAIVSVEDSGLVMGDVQLRRAEQAVSGGATGLGGLTGTRLGLAVVGRLARKYGLKVSFRPSARGGTGVLVLIPQDILTTAAPEPRSTSPAQPQPAAPSVRQPPADTVSATPATGRDATDEEAPDGPSGLPRRRRGRTLAAAEQARSVPRDTEHRTEPAAGDIRTRADRFGAFRQAVRTTPGETSGHHPLPPTPQQAQAARSASSETAPDISSRSPRHPEGDTTS